MRLAVELAEQRRVGVGQVAELVDVFRQLLCPDLIGQHHLAVVEPLVEQRGLLLLDDVLRPPLRVGGRVRRRLWGRLRLRWRGCGAALGVLELALQLLVLGLGLDRTRFPILTLPSLVLVGAARDDRLALERFRRIGLVLGLWLGCGGLGGWLGLCLGLRCRRLWRCLRGWCGASVTVAVSPARNCSSCSLAMMVLGDACWWRSAPRLVRLADAERRPSASPVGG